MSDERLLQVIVDSGLYRASEHVVNWALRVAHESVLINRLHRAYASPGAGGERRRSAGLMLIVAGVVHTVVQSLNAPPGWLWLVIPVWATWIGVLLRFASGSRSHEIVS